MANTSVQVFRTSVVGRQPNTTVSSNSQYIDAGGLALNMPDQILYTSNGSTLIVVGANAPSYSVSGGNVAINASGVFVANSTGVVNAAVLSVGTSFVANTTQVTISGIPLSANASNGTVGQILTSNGSTGAPFWGSPGQSKRVISYANSSTFTVNSDSTDVATMIYTGATGTFTIANTTTISTVKDGQQLVYRIQATNSQTLSFQAQFAGSTDLALPTALTGSSKYDYLGFMYNSTAGKWQLLAKNFGF
jgi:hypothetical protein